MKYLTAYIATYSTFMLLDLAWLGFVAKSFYDDQLGALKATEINITVAAAFYAMYIGGILLFAIRPALESSKLSNALVYGALFGFFCYATYDLTNLATIRDWPIVMSIVDIIWGTFLTGVSSVIGAWITKHIHNV